MPQRRARAAVPTHQAPDDKSKNEAPDGPQTDGTPVGRNRVKHKSGKSGLRRP
ncbi:hypothetical protein GCM10027074_29060 [Streptomyces deserti]